MTDRDYDQTVERRLQAQAITAYLEALRAQKPTVSREVVLKRIEKAEKALIEAEEKGLWLRAMDAMERLAQHQRTLAELDTIGSIEHLEQRFIEVAKDYGDRKELSYETWRYMNVPPKVLKAAGIQ
jgi:hypothetical protein